MRAGPMRYKNSSIGEAFNGHNELRRELREVRPWPKNLHFEDETNIEPRSVGRFARETLQSYSSCPTQMACEALKYSLL